MDEALAEAAALLRHADRVVVLTGAGISTDSGIQDFRGPNGLWTKNPEAEKMATLEHYVADADLRGRAWQRRLQTLSDTYQPNAGHRALVDLERTGRLHVLVTQNIDGLHHAAGTSADLVVEIHGNMRETECLGCGEHQPMSRVLDRVRAGEQDPPCLACGGILKSATISFGQSFVHADLVRSERAVRECDLLLAVGSTLGVYPAANLVPLAKMQGAAVVIVNGSPTEMDDLADVILTGSISDVLPALVAAAVA